MKVKIDDKIYDSDDEPMMVILTVDEKQLIADMEGSKFAGYDAQ